LIKEGPYLFQVAKPEGVGNEESQQWLYQPLRLENELLGIVVLGG
jgi:hypothetical protein